jgi:hypothetical protein
MAEKRRAILAKLAKERMEAGKNQHSPKENFPEGSTGQTRDALGASIGVSGKTYDALVKTDIHGIPELVEAVRKQLEVFFLS